MTHPYRQHQEVMRQELRDDPAQVSAYLRVALEEFDRDGDRTHLLVALQNVMAAWQGEGTTATPAKPFTK